MVEAVLPIDPDRQSLFGHSFGGLFVLYSLFTRPSAFTTWIAASPSIYWENRTIDQYYLQFAAAPRQEKTQSCSSPAGNMRPISSHRFKLVRPTRQSGSRKRKSH